jgi:cell division transport system ATP-binding protein
MRLFKRFSEVGVTVMVATHDVHLIEQMGVRRIALRNGRVADGAHSPTGAGTP